MSVAGDHADSGLRQLGVFDSADLRLAHAEQPEPLAGRISDLSQAARLRAAQCQVLSSGHAMQRPKGSQPKETPDLGAGRSPRRLRPARDCRR